MASRTSESAFNAELAGALRDRHPRWGGAAVLAEATGVFRGAAARQPDILLTGEAGAPVVIETEYEPARSVESEALGRLGAIIDETGLTVAAVLAVRVPLELRDSPAGHLSDLVSSAQYRFCCHAMNSATATAGAAGPVRHRSAAMERCAAVVPGAVEPRRRP